MKLLLAMLVVFAFGGPAIAQSTCGPYAGMIVRLNAQYGETMQSAGRAQFNIFEMWASEETGTWTILEVFPSGMACVRAAGEGWTVGPPTVPGKSA